MSIMARSGFEPVTYAWLLDVGNSMVLPVGVPSHSKPLRQQSETAIDGLYMRKVSYVDTSMEIEKCF